jgi:ribosomal protein S12 methylthiotransferase accessory factor
MFSSCTVEVQTIGAIDPGPLAGMLASFGLRTNASGSPVVRIVLTDDYLQPELARINRDSLAQRMPLLLVKPVGTRLWIGPLIIPGRTACWKCLESRLRGNREVETYVERKTGRPGPFPVARARLAVTEYQAYAMAALQLLRWLATGANPAIESRLLVTDVTAFSFGFHDIIRRPQCPDCGDPGLGLKPTQLAGFNGNGASRESQNGVRSEPPEATFARLQHHISPFTGIVRSVTPSIWHGAGPLRVYMAGHNFALKSDELYFLKDGLRTHSSGKGRTDAQAKTSALCEALERYSGVFRGDEPRVLKSYEELGDDAVDPRTLMLFSDTQYAERQKWLARRSRFQIVPLPFNPKQRLEWTPVWSLTKKRNRYLPTSYLFYNYPTPPEHFYCWADSNGAAAGCTMEEAMLQGLLELVERDAVALWWYNRIRRPGADLHAFDDGFASEVKEFYKGHNRKVWVLDLTSDLGPPAFAAISRRVHGPTEDIMLGFGAHLDARIALNRAVTELNQFIPALLNVAPDGRTIYVLGDPDAVNWWTTAKVETETYLLPAERIEPATPASFGSPKAHGAAGMLHGLVETLEQKGYEVLALDQTRPDIGLPVVKMMVPGLRHFWARFAPGRLYDVPPAMKWRSGKLSEAELNPTPLFL